MRKPLLIVGHGYFGGHLSESLQNDTFDIFATTRRREQLTNLNAQGLKGICFDVLDSSAAPIQEKFHAIVYCVGYDSTQSASRHEVYCNGLQNFLTKLETPPERFIYISSTGVYGQAEGQWVTEESETNPTREGGKACLAAERVLGQQIDEWDNQTELVILRLAGIYGPNRIPNRTRLEQGQLSMNSEGFLNLIHVQDAASICRQFILARNPGESSLHSEKSAARKRVFNVSDGHPPTRLKFYHRLAELLGIDPPLIKNDSEAAPSRREGSKKVDNRKLLTETGYKFLFPSFQVGLSNVVE